MPGSGTTVSVTSPAQDRAGVPAAEGREPGEQLVQDRRQGVDVDGGARREALDEFGGEVVRGADDLRGAGAARGVDELGDAEVGQERRVGAAGTEGALHVQEDVLRLHVAVHDPGGVRGGEPVRDVRDDGDRGLGGQAPLTVEPGAQVGAPYEVHDQSQVVPVDHQVTDADHARVVEAEQGRALLDEAAHELLVGGQVLTQQLDGDGPLGSLAQPHRAGAAASQDLVRGVPAADLPCQDCSYRRVLAPKLRGSGANHHIRGGNHPSEVDKSPTSRPTPGARGSLQLPEPPLPLPRSPIQPVTVSYQSDSWAQ